MSFNDAIGLYRDVIRRFEKIEGRPWGAEGAVMELAKQVGELAKYVMQQEKYYFFSVDAEENKKNISDELADVFGQIIRIADYYKFDLLEAHIEARKGEARCLDENGA
ncbi:MAG: MazG-like family protein [Oscillospiraceae bacterium]|nr:MazG-like family protein [Oscillospiraceae bacterium]